MKQISINILIIIYQTLSLFILCVAILYPFMINMKDKPLWLKWYLIYPLTLLIIASQKKMFKLINKYQDLS